LKCTIGMSVEGLGAFNQVPDAAVVDEGLIQLGSHLRWPEVIRKLLDDVLLRLEDSKNQV